MPVAALIYKRAMGKLYQNLPFCLFIHFILKILYLTNSWSSCVSYSAVMLPVVILSSYLLKFFNHMFLQLDLL